MDGVAVAAPAAVAAGDVPRIGSAAVAVLTDHVGLAGTLAAALVALALVGGGTGLRCCAQRLAHALCTEGGRSSLKRLKLTERSLPPETRYWGIW